VADPEHVKIVRQGKDAVANWRSTEIHRLFETLGYDHYYDSDAKLDLTGADLSGLDLPGVNLTAANLTDADLSGTDLQDASLRGARLIRTRLVGARLSGAKLQSARFQEANLSSAELRKADLSNADLADAGIFNADLTEANLYAADLTAAQLLAGQLWRANLHKAKLKRTRINTENMSETNLAEADLSDAEISGTDLQGSNLTGSNLSRADLTGARTLDPASSLAHANLSGAKLIDAKLAGVNLTATNLSRADLTSADLRGANLQLAELIDAKLTGADMTDADLTRTRILGSSLENAVLVGCRIYGIAAWDVRLEGARQSNLVITPAGETSVTVDDIELGQFIYLLLYNPNVRRIIDTITSRVVLLLGRFSAERKPALDALRHALRQHGYSPVLFDFEKPSSRDLTETISTLAHMARFVIADITEARSIPQELAMIVPGLPSVPVQPLLLRGEQEYAMFEHYLRYPWVLPVYEYDSVDGLLESIDEKVIEPVEDVLAELRSERDDRPHAALRDEHAQDELGATGRPRPPALNLRRTSPEPTCRMRDLWHVLVDTA
jgi:uncharacterized protein YjbI with pentapeptide repeats